MYHQDLVYIEIREVLFMENLPTVFVLEKNLNSGEILNSYLEEFGFKDIKIFQNYEEGCNEIKQKDAIVFADITDCSPQTMSSVDTIKLHTSKIVITSTDYSTNTIVKAMKLGAKEFLPKPIIKEDLRRVLTMLMQTETEESASKIITIYSNKGGIGKTTIAVNLATEIAKVTGDKTALIDLNLQLGDVSTFLDLKPGFDVSYVINNLTDKKESVLLQAFEKYKNTNLYVLSDPNYIEQSESIKPQQIETLFKTLKKVFPFIIVDMSSNIDGNSLKMLDLSDIILFTTIVNIPAIRNSQRCLNLFKSRRYPAGKVKIVLNRYMDNDEIKVEDIENTLGEKIYWKIPNNYFSIMEAINKGITAGEVSSESNIANNFRDFASKISDDIVEETLMKFRI